MISDPSDRKLVENRLRESKRNLWTRDWESRGGSSFRGSGVCDLKETIGPRSLHLLALLASMMVVTFRQPFPQSPGCHHPERHSLGGKRTVLSQSLLQNPGLHCELPGWGLLLTHGPITRARGMTCFHWSFQDQMPTPGAGGWGLAPSEP